MKRILVIDQATIKTAYNIIEIDCGKPKWICCSVIKIKTTDNVIHRINELYNKLSEIIDEYNIDTLVLEEVPVSRKTNLNVSIVLLKLLGAMELLACRKNINVEIMNVALWKNTSGEVPVSRKTNLNVSIVLLKLLGAMELLACRKNINVEIMNVALWKNTSGIKSRTRNEQKKESIQLALKRFPAYKSIIADSDDCSDALNMGYAFLKNKKLFDKI